MSTDEEAGNERGASTSRVVISVLVLAVLGFIGYVAYGVVGAWDEASACEDNRAAVTTAAAKYLADAESIPGADSAARIDALVMAGLVSDLPESYLNGALVLNLEADGTAKCVEVES